MPKGFAWAGRPKTARDGRAAPVDVCPGDGRRHTEKIPRKFRSRRTCRSNTKGGVGVVKPDWSHWGSRAVGVGVRACQKAVVMGVAVVVTVLSVAVVHCCLVD